MFINYYEILGVDPAADLVQITAAWKRMLEKHQTDLDSESENALPLINKAFEVLSDPVKRKRFDQELEEQRQSSSQTFNQSNNQSSEKSSNTNPKKDKTFVWTGVGIILGAATAFPIGLFLVWAISGFDPVGIFRSSDNNGDELAKASRQSREGAGQGSSLDENSTDQEKRLPEPVRRAIDDFRNELKRVKEDYAIKIADVDSELENKAGEIQGQLLTQLDAAKSKGKSLPNEESIEQLIDKYSVKNFVDLGDTTKLSEADSVQTVNAQIEQLSGILERNKTSGTWAIAGKWKRNDGIIFDIKNDGKFHTKATSPVQRIKPVHQSGHAFACKNYILLFYPGEARKPRVHRLVSRTESIRIDKVFSMKRIADDLDSTVSEIEPVKSYRASIRRLQNEYRTRVAKIDAEVMKVANHVRSQMVQKLNELQIEKDSDDSNLKSELDELVKKYSQPCLVGDAEVSTQLDAHDQDVFESVISRVKQLESKLVHVNNPVFRSGKRVIPGYWLRSGGIAFDIQADGTFRQVKTKPGLVIRPAHESGFAFSSPNFLILFYLLEPQNPRVHSFIDDKRTRRIDRKFTLQKTERSN